MFDIQKLIRENIKSLKPYSSARAEYTGATGIFLDANENPYGTLNRYPDPYQNDLKEHLSLIKGIDADNIFISNGSDEAIDLIIRIFCNPGIDKILTFTPTYGMYEVASAINNVTLIEVPLDKDFQLDMLSMKTAFEDEKLKIIFICNPNNPTGNVIPNIEIILQTFQGIVVVDEAYIDFASMPSYITMLKKYPQLVVIQTLSKAWALAGARIGITYAGAAIIQLLNKVKPPYNISKPNQDAALKALKDCGTFETRLNTILEQRAWLTAQLKTFPFIKKVYPSDANFILIETTDADYIYNGLVAKQIITRNRNQIIPNCIRISIGKPLENKKLMETLLELNNNYKTLTS